MFLISKLVAYTLLGLLLGFLGSSISLSPTTKGYLQIFIGIYLLGIAGATLDIHPLFRYFIIKPPKFLAKLVKDQTKSESLFAPSLLGAFTVFLPCATTQAMEIVALGTANPIYAAAIMFAFVLGTSPTFFVLGFLYNKMSGAFRGWFSKASAALLLVMGLITINAGLTLTDSAYTYQNFYKVVVNQKSTEEPTTVMGDNIQTATITITNSGYSPNSITIKKGIKTRLTLNSDNVQSCARAFTIPSFNIEKMLPVNGATIIEFTPEKVGPLAFSCTMGMYTGQFNVIN
jgi:sulfite exporter TauE/SafE